jgi:DNA-binding response OmpR family regulator
MSKGKQRILVVDDEPRYIWAVRVNLESRGYEVLVAENGRQALEIAAREDLDLILLDLRMPEMDGLEACRHIRQFSTVPIIILTAMADEADKVVGLDAGADDYLTKPFSVEELLARVRAALRRVEYGGGLVSQPALKAGELTVDFAQKRVLISGHEIHLTPTEYRLLCTLAKQPGRVLVPDYLLEKVWGSGYEGENRLLRQAVHRLRHKLEPDPSQPQYIQTRAGIGYLFAVPE